MHVALITGGSKGFGRALAAELVREGWTVILDGRDEAVLEAAAADLRRRLGKVVAIAGDVVDEGHRRALVAAATAAGRLDLLVNNASTLGLSPLPALDRYP